jgi:small neutral amino acid transporter SnatA (MarC family)
MPVLRVGGGMIVAMAGWKLLHTSDDESDGTTWTVPQHTPLSLRTKAFYPITLPIMVGPGAMVVTIALVAWMADRFAGEAAPIRAQACGDQSPAARLNTMAA